MISFWPVHLFIVFLATSYNQSFNHGSTSTRTRETPAAFGAILQSPLQDKLSEFLNKGWGGFSPYFPALHLQLSLYSLRHLRQLHGANSDDRIVPLSLSYFPQAIAALRKILDFFIPLLRGLRTSRDFFPQI